MNVKLFKKLIREAVIEALHEELPDIINETLAKQNKQYINENRSFSFTSDDITPKGTLPADVRSSLAAKMGMEFGFQAQRNDLKVIDKVDESTGEKVNPYLNFIADAAANMTAMDRSGLRQLD